MIVLIVREKMRRLAALLLPAALILVIFTDVYAQEVTPIPTPTPEAVAEKQTEMEDPGILPDSPFYVLKTFWERVQEVLARDPAKEAELNLRFARRRLLETQKMCEKGKCEIAERFMNRFQERLQKATSLAEKAQEQGRDVTSLVEKLQENSRRQQQVLDRVLEKAPEEAKEAILKAREKSSRGLNQAIETIQKEKPVRPEQREERKVPETELEKVVKPRPREGVEIERR